MSGVRTFTITHEQHYSHVQRVDGQVVGRELERLEDVREREEVAVAVRDDLVAVLPQLALDEAQQVLLVHARAVVDLRGTQIFNPTSMCA